MTKKIGQKQEQGYTGEYHNYTTNRIIHFKNGEVIKTEILNKEAEEWIPEWKKSKTKEQTDEPQTQLEEWEK